MSMHLCPKFVYECWPRIWPVLRWSSELSVLVIGNNWERRVLDALAETILRYGMHPVLQILYEFADEVIYWMGRCIYIYRASKRAKWIGHLQNVFTVGSTLHRTAQSRCAHWQHCSDACVLGKVQSLFEADPSEMKKLNIAPSNSKISLCSGLQYSIGQFTNCICSEFEQAIDTIISFDCVN